jgi:hypothetical protein
LQGFFVFKAGGRSKVRKDASKLILKTMDMNFPNRCEEMIQDTIKKNEEKIRTNGSLSEENNTELPEPELNYPIDKNSIIRYY